MGSTPPAAAAGLVPRFEGAETVLLATGMLGATVMPHVIYLHGALTQNRYVRGTEEERLALLRSQRVDVVVAMGLAGLINLSMLTVAAQNLSNLPVPVDTIEAAYEGLGATLGPTAALLFGLALLASGFAASGVGTYSGQVVMQGFLRRRIPLVVRRLVTLAPALIIIAAGVDTTAALVHLAGGALVRNPVRADPAGSADPAARRDGRPGQSPVHDVRRRRGGHGHLLASTSP